VGLFFEHLIKIKFLAKEMPDFRVFLNKYGSEVFVFWFDCLYIERDKTKELWVLSLEHFDYKTKMHN
jgi:transposase